MNKENKSYKVPEVTIVMARQCSFPSVFLAESVNSRFIEKAFREYAIKINKYTKKLQNLYLDLYEEISKQGDNRARNILIKQRRKINKVIRLINTCKVRSISDISFFSEDCQKIIREIDALLGNFEDELEKKLFKEYEQWIEHLRNDDLILAGLARASTSFTRDLVSWEGSLQDANPKFLRTLTRYFLRICLKPSPFATLAGVVSINGSKLPSFTYTIEPALWTWIRRCLVIDELISLNAVDTPYLKKAIEGKDAVFVSSYCVTSHGFLSRQDEVFPIQKIENRGSGLESYKKVSDSVEIGIKTVEQVDIDSVIDILDKHDAYGSSKISKVNEIVNSVAKKSSVDKILDKNEEFKDSLIDMSRWLSRPCPPFAKDINRIVHETYYRGSVEKPSVENALLEIKDQLSSRIRCSNNYLKIVNEFKILYGNHERVPLLDFCAAIILRSEQLRLFHGKSRESKDLVTPQRSVPKPVSSICFELLDDGRVVINSVTPFWLNYRARWADVKEVSSDIDNDIKLNIEYAFKDLPVYLFSSATDWNGLQKIPKMHSLNRAGLPADITSNDSNFEEFSIGLNNGQLDIFDPNGMLCGLVYCGGISPWSLSGIERILCEISMPWRFTFGERFQSTTITDFGKISPRIDSNSVVYGRKTWTFSRKYLPYISKRMETEEYISLLEWWEHHQIPDEVFISFINDSGLREKPVYCNRYMPSTVEAALLCSDSTSAVEIAEALPKVSNETGYRTEFVASLRH